MYIYQQKQMLITFMGCYYIVFFFLILCLLHIGPPLEKLQAAVFLTERCMTYNKNIPGSSVF